MLLDIDFIYEDARWGDIDFSLETDTHKAFNKIIENGSVSVMLADDAFVQKLNKQYRAKDKPTNILSFPMGDDEILGDLILSFDTIEKEAKDQQKSFQNHYIHLIVHGLLHLLGYDHINEEDAQIMEAKEIEILSQLKIANPYI